MATEEQEDFAALAGVTAAYFKVTPEMWKLFQDALDEQWAPNRLQSAIRNTKWFKKTSQTEREAWLLKSSDKAEYNRRLGDITSTIGRMATELGFRPPDAVLKQIANQALVRGWNEAQIRQNLGNRHKAWDRAWTKGQIGGDLATTLTRLRAAANDYGVKLSDRWYSRYMQAIARGTQTEEGLMEAIKRQAMSAFPGLQDEIKAGQTVRDVADAYIQTMARVWEVNPEDVDLFTPQIRQALSSKDPQGKLGQKSLWEFEVDLKRDPRWLKTKNAREESMSAGRSVLEMMGVLA